MSRILCLTLLASLTFAPFIFADETWLGSADVRFKGYSTLHNFEGTVKGVPLKVTVAGEKGSRVVDATSNVRVKEMSTANNDRDRSMWNMFNEAQFKLIKIEVSKAQEKVLKPKGGNPGSMPITLSIAGNRGTVSGAVTNVSETPTDVSFDLAFPVSLKSLKLEPPKAVGGLVSVKDTVDATARITLKKSKAE
jgi:hypothetical protein